MAVALTALWAVWRHESRFQWPNCPSNGCDALWVVRRCESCYHWPSRPSNGCDTVCFASCAKTSISLLVTKWFQQWLTLSALLAVCRRDHIRTCVNISDVWTLFRLLPWGWSEMGIPWVLNFVHEWSYRPANIDRRNLSYSLIILKIHVLRQEKYFLNIFHSS